MNESSVVAKDHSVVGCPGCSKRFNPSPDGFRAYLTATVASLALLTSAAAAPNKPLATSRGKIRADAVPGYRIRSVQGFTLLLSRETLKHAQDKVYERKPLEVLELETKTLVRIMPARVIKLLRTVPIWVEWDVKKAMPNGRPGFAMAMYYGGHQLQMLEDGEHPLKAKCVVIHRMRSLTEARQPRNDPGGSLLLHEMAHAVHMELLGVKDTRVANAYMQAMERRLYDRRMYASTNELEFFAEMSCSYYGQLREYPHNRAELKKHDPVTYQLMERIWGKSGQGGPAPAAGKSAADLTPRVGQLDLGRPVLGRRVGPKDLKGRPVLLLLWNAGSTESLSSLARLSTWDAELSSFGLVTVGVHLTGSESHDVTRAARNRKIGFPVTEARWTNRSLVKDFKDFPLCLVFDQEGGCIFRGTPFAAERAVRSAAGRALVAATGRKSFTGPVNALAESLQKGTTPSLVLARLCRLAAAAQPEVAGQAKELVAKMTEVGRERLEEAIPLIRDDPVVAYFKLEQLSALFKGTPVASRATLLLKQLRQNKNVQAEIRARAALRDVARLDIQLHSRTAGFALTSERFRRDNAELLRRLRRSVEKMKQAWPHALATEEAVRVGRQYDPAVR